MVNRKPRSFLLFLTLSLAFLTGAMAHGATRMAQESEDMKPPTPMATYIVGLLKKGPKWTAESTPATAEIQKGHLAHLGKMADMGKLVGAGPLLDNGELRGILIFNLASADEALALAQQDPAVTSGRLIVEVHPWLGPEGIGREYFDRVKADAHADVHMVQLQLAFLVKGANWTADQTPALADLQKRHLKNIFALLGSGEMLAAGPFLDDGWLRGVFVFGKESVDAAKALAETDPAVASGHLAVEIHPWMVADGVIPKKK